MKKIFLLLGITISISAIAQQKELFDIDRYIQKKQAEKMKADTKENPIHFFQKEHIFNYPISNNPQRNYTLANGDRVITFPFDNMPCIIPDMKQFQIMPNLGVNIPYYNSVLLPKKIPGAIPNGALPFKVIVADKSGY